MPLCYPPFGWWPLLFIVFPLLLLATSNTTPRRACYFGILQGTIGYGASLFWLYNIFNTAAIAFFIIMALFSGFFCLLFNSLTNQTRSSLLHVLLGAALWTAIEFYRSELFFLRFPWITPGAAFGPTALSPFLGVYGASFLVIATSAACMKRKTWPAAAVLLFISFGLVLFRPGPVALPDDQSITVTVVQNEGCVLDTLIEQSMTANSPDLILWPECALPYDVRKQPADYAMLTNLCAAMDALLVVGTRTDVGPGVKEWHNTALILNANGVVGEYYKARPVHFFNDGIPGTNFYPTQTVLGAMATPICFDCDYSDISRKMTMLGAEFFATPSYDDKMWSAKQHFQHAQLFRLRAAENGRWFACAASSGVSQFIDPHGNVHCSIPPMDAGVLTYNIGKNNNITFYSRIGWLFPWLTIISSLLFIAYCLCCLFRCWGRFLLPENNQV